MNGECESVKPDKISVHWFFRPKWQRKTGQDDQSSSSRGEGLGLVDELDARLFGETFSGVAPPNKALHGDQPHSADEKRKQTHPAVIPTAAEWHDEATDHYEAGYQYLGLVFLAGQSRGNAPASASSAAEQLEANFDCRPVPRFMLQKRQIIGSPLTSSAQ